jgi:hypothetical protein
MMPRSGHAPGCPCDVRPTTASRYRARLNGPITLISLLGWGLAHHEAFRGRRFLCTVDVPAVGGRERTIGFVSIRPSLYFRGNGRSEGFLAFQKEFTRLLNNARGRADMLHKLLNGISVLPPVFYQLLGQALRPALPELVGSVGITTVKGADLFLAPSVELIVEGFVAFGNCSIPTQDQHRAGWVSVKGSRETTERYSDAIQEVISDFGRFL